jgi:hypothetical protein
MHRVLVGHESLLFRAKIPAVFALKRAKSEERGRFGSCEILVCVMPKTPAAPWSSPKESVIRTILFKRF